ncbi:MAG: DUF1523 family protein [Paracoccus sp. (in: a-proteobacteria)]
MRWFLTVLGVIFGIAVFMFLDYALPSRQTVRISDAYNRLTDIGGNAIFYASPDTGTVQNAQGQRDVRFINAVRANGKPYVYRNEDTGWIWPPYFKYDSSNLQAEATDFKSDVANPRWVSVTSYGWRISWLSIYPNAISMRPVAGPDVKPFNWPAQIILAVLGAILFLIWRMWNQFRERTIDPAVRSADEALDRLDAGATQAQGRVRRWWSGVTGR